MQSGFLLAQKPDYARKSITFDNGVEFTRHGLLNNMPRKCLGFRTPAEVYNEELRKCVALQH